MKDWHTLKPELLKKQLYYRPGCDTSQIGDDQLVEKVLLLMDEEERQQISNEFPPGFGKAFCERSTKIMSFAFLLFSIGAAPTGKVYQGPTDAQKQKYRAQFLDCMHIGLASNFQAFLTNDQNAHRLAAAVFAYAKVPAASIYIAPP
jgi:hypothetical protein